MEIAESQHLTDDSTSANPFDWSAVRWIFLAFAVAFAVKVPLFPLHTWLPDAHTQAPTAGSVILAGVMLKLGTYGFVRFGLYLFPEASVWFAPALVTLGVIGIIYGAIVATMQRDLKRLVAYSSVAHLGFIILGTFALTTQGIQGGVMQMVNHGLSTGALFLLVGMIYDRRHTREIAALKGLQKSAPILAGVFTLVMLSSIGLPGLNGFAGEFLILVGSFLTRRWFTVVAAVGVILAALYLLWAYQRVFHGEPDEENADTPDLSWKEGLVMAPLLGLIVFLGVYPQPMLDRIEPSVDRLVTHIEDHSDYVRARGRHRPAPVTRPTRSTTTRRRRGGGAVTPLLAILAPADRPGPGADRRRRRRLVGAGPDAHPDRRGARCCSWPTRSRPRKPLRSVYALFTTVIAAGGHRVRRSRCGTACRTRTRGPFSTLGQAVGVDGFSVFATVTIAAAVILGALLLDGWLRREGMEGAEPYVLMLLSASGGVMMASANDLIVMFLGLEILSIAVYVLAAMHLRKITSQEAGVKYFVLGAFSSAFFLYGIALTYGGTGSTNLVDIADFLATTVLADTGLVLAGLALLLVGFAFKVAAVPFHFWTPDVYQGAPSPSVAWMASGVKVAGFAGLLRVFYLRLRHLPARLAADRLRRRRPHDGRRLGARRRADRREAHAGLQLDQPRRASSSWPCRPRASRAWRRRSSTWPPTRSWWPAASASSR